MNLSDRIDRDIAKSGRSVICVFPMPDSTDAPNDAFTYTIGNWQLDLPELCLIGSHQTVAVLNILSRMMIERGVFGHGQVVQMPGAQCPVCIFDAKEEIKDEYTVQATHKIGRANCRVMQVVMSDPAGNFPWEDTCSRPYRDVLLYSNLGAKKKKYIDNQKARMKERADA